MTALGALVARRRMPLAALAAVLLSGVMVLQATQAAFTATTGTPANNVGTGSVVLTDNDANSALFTMTNATPGTSQTKCINVAYTGNLNSQVRLYATGVGTLAPYLTLTVTRGTFSSVPGSGSCTNFTGDATNYKGAGAGVIYTGLLSAFPSAWLGGLVDPTSTTSPEVWTNPENHAYQLALTVVDDNNAQNKSSTPTFTWEARDTSAAYTAAVLADSPVGYWRLGEGAGTTANDGSGAGRHGNHIGSPALGQTGALAGDTNTAYGLDPSNGNDGAEVAYSAAHNPSQFTAEAWVKPNHTPGNSYGILSTIRWSPASGYGLGITTANQWVLNAYPGSPIAGGTPVIGTWTHVVGTFDGTTGRLYVNGALVASAPTSYTPNAAEEFVIGSTNWVDFFKGTIDEVALYNSALSLSRIQAHYDAGR